MSWRVHIDDNVTPNSILGYERDVDSVIRHRTGYHFEDIPLEEVGVSNSVPDTIISIPEVVAETVPLLSSGVGASASVGGIISGTSAGLGAVAVLGAGAVGYLANRATSTGFTLPGHHYIGPGNPLDGKSAVDRDDEIAKEHDEAYAKAKTADDVRVADSKAVQDFVEDCKSGNLHSCVGAAGIGAKQFVEKHIGVIYPSVSGT